MEPWYGAIKSCRSCAPITVYLAATTPAPLSPQQLEALAARVRASLLAAQPQLAAFPEFAVVAFNAPSGGAVVAVALPPGQVGRAAAAYLVATSARCAANPIDSPAEGICAGPIQVVCGECKPVPPIGRPPPPGGYGGWRWAKHSPPAHRGHKRPHTKVGHGGKLQASKPKANNKQNQDHKRKQEKA